MANEFAPCTEAQKAAVLERLAVIRQNIADSCAAAGRDVSDVTLMAVTKTVSPELINLAVDLEHIDISDKMNQSLQTLKSDLETMMGKDDQQDKSVKRKATIENKGRDLKRTSTKGSDLKGAPSVKQIEMKSN